VTRLLLTLGSALLYGAAVPPLALAPLGWVMLAPFFAAVAGVRPRRGAVLGLVWGTVATWATAWWLPAMLGNFFRLAGATRWSAFVAIAVGSAGIHFAVLGAWLAWLSRRGPVHPVVVAAGWTAAELARARFGLANPWALAGYSQASVLPLVQIVDVTGPYGLSFLVAATGAVAAGLAVRALAGRRPVRARTAVAAAVAAALAYGAWRLAAGVDEGPPIRVAIVQGGIERRFGESLDPLVAAGRYAELTRSASSVAPELIVWPEYSVDVTLQQPSPTFETVRLLTRDLAADLVVGAPHFRLARDGMHHRNSVFLFHDGSLSGRADKLRLLPFAEATPAWWPRRPRGEQYEPGERPTPLKTAHARVGALVCVESMHPEVARAQVEAGAELLANLSNDYWFGDPSAARQQLQSARMRAVETRRWMVRATPPGFSAAIDPLGRVVAESGWGTTEVLTPVVHPVRGSTVYGRWGDAFAWLAAGLAAAATVAALTTRARPQ
jgi:apolipoprotein N-acyltransferase